MGANKENNRKDLEALRNRIIGKIWSIIAAPLITSNVLDIPT